MFERFSAEARAIVVRARQEAADLRHPQIGTEHLLLGMLTGPGLAGDLLRQAGLDPDRARAALLAIAGRGQALLDQEDAEALRSVGIDVEAVIARIEESFGPDALLPPAPAGPRGWFGRGRRPGRGGLTPRAKKVLELGLREAVRLHAAEIRSGHLLLGLLRDGGGLACRLLADAGVDLPTLRTRTESALRPAA